MLELMPTVIKPAKDIQDYLERKLTVALTVEFEDKRVCYKALSSTSSFSCQIAGYIRDFFQETLRIGILKSHSRVYINNEDVELLHTILRLEGKL
ncbi:MAG: hypothetical protein ACI4V7_12280 [Succinivibrionaceae bacterium]